MSGLFWALGAELWVGCLVVGAGTGAIGYAATYFAIINYRRRRARRRPATRKRALEPRALAAATPPPPNSG